MILHVVALPYVDIESHYPGTAQARVPVLGPQPKQKKSSSVSGTSSDSLMEELRRKISTGSQRRHESHWMSDTELIEAPLYEKLYLK